MRLRAVVGRADQRHRPHLEYVRWFESAPRDVPVAFLASAFDLLLQTLPPQAHWTRAMVKAGRAGLPAAWLPASWQGRPTMDWILLAFCVLLVAGNAAFVAAELVSSRWTATRWHRRLKPVTGDRAVYWRPLDPVHPVVRRPAGHHHHVIDRRLPRRAGTRRAARRSVAHRGSVRDSGGHAVSVVVALLIATVFQMVLGELVPKNRPLPAVGVARAVAPLQRGFTTATKPSSSSSTEARIGCFDGSGWSRKRNSPPAGRQKSCCPGPTIGACRHPASPNGEPARPGVAPPANGPPPTC